MSEKRALTKFLRCVDWSDAQVSNQILDNSKVDDSRHSVV